jgi:predicted permease
VRSSSRACAWGDAFSADLRFALHSALSRPLPTVAVILTIAIGIGAATTTFGIMRRLLLQPPPHVADPGRLSQLYFEDQRGDGSVYTSDLHSYPLFATLRDNSRDVAEVAAFGSIEELSVSEGARAARIRTQVVSGEFWRILGVQPLLGRFFLDQETSPTSGHRAVVLSHAFWTRYFGANPGVVGSALTIRGLPYQIVGVAPMGFRGLGLSAGDVWLPLFSRTDLDHRRANWHTFADSRELHMVVRRRVAATQERVASELSALYRAFTESNGQNRTRAVALLSVRLAPVTGVFSREMRRIPEATVSVWLAGVGFVLLLISCANVAGLLLIRTLRRRNEIAMRLALGMTRGRLFGLLFAEGFLLALAGAAGSVMITIWGRALTWGVLFPNLNSEDLPFDWNVIWLTAGCTIATALLVSLAPMTQGHAKSVGALRITSAAGSGRRSRLQAFLLVAQTALSVILLMGAGMFVRSLWRVTTQDIGLEPRRVLAVQVDFVGSGRSRGQIARFYERALEATRTLPGVQHATMAVSIPLRGALGSRVRLPGQTAWVGGDNGTVRHNLVADGFFESTGMIVTYGRDVLPSDRVSSPRLWVNETFAQTAWPNRSPIGECVYLESGPDACVTVVGVAKDARSFSVVDQSAEPWVYQVLPAGDSTGAYLRALLVRTAPDAHGVEAALRRTFAELEPGLPVVDVRRLEEEIEPEIRPWRVGAVMFSALGAIAVLLAALGIYAVLACSVAVRTREIGVRLASGATTGNIVRLIVSDGLRLTGTGIAAGTGVTLASGRWFNPLLFQTSVNDALVVGSVLGTVFAFALLAVVIPAWRAARVSPLVALQTD